MKFKIEVFRDILIFLEEILSYENPYIESTKIQIKDYSSDDIAYHIELLVEEGLILVDHEDSPHLFKYREFYIRRLTMKGHEFLASIRNDTVWKKMTETSKSLGVEVIKSAIPILLTYAKTQLGIP